MIFCIRSHSSNKYLRKWSQVVNYFLGKSYMIFPGFLYLFGWWDLLEQGVLSGKLTLFFTTTVLLSQGKCFELVTLLIVVLFLFLTFISTVVSGSWHTNLKCLRVLLGLLCLLGMIWQWEPKQVKLMSVILVPVHMQQSLEQRWYYCSIFLCFAWRAYIIWDEEEENVPIAHCLVCVTLHYCR